MENLQVVINHYGDADLLRGTLASLDEELPGTTVHVADGRYANFDRVTPGDLTPETPDLCSRYENVHYHAPDEERLPFGEGETGRGPIHRKATWLWYEVADPSTWALKIDADERLREFAVDLDGLDRETKYTVNLRTKGENYTNARLWVPENWTFYVDDICMPRAEVPRSASFESLRDLAGPSYTWTNLSRETREAVRIENLHHKRRGDYRESREQQKDEFET